VAARPEDCICCKLCEIRCPDLAIEIRTEQPSNGDDDDRTN
jgi:2-oxoglutarate ferredoxin oxidoreductase subunit delta